jgi:hypothetical protein
MNKITIEKDGWVWIEFDENDMTPPANFKKRGLGDIDVDVEIIDLR